MILFSNFFRKESNEAYLVVKMIIVEKNIRKNL